MRWVVTVVAVLLAVAAGLFVGYVRWGMDATHAERVEQRLESTQSEAVTLRSENEQLEQRLQQVTKEQERLAQENEILRKQQTTERLLGGPGGPLPELPPK
jgi:preprotein translocase subunit SecF